MPASSSGAYGNQIEAQPGISGTSVLALAPCLLAAAATAISSSPAAQPMSITSPLAYWSLAAR